MNIANCHVTPVPEASCKHPDDTPLAPFFRKPPSISRLQTRRRCWHAPCKDRHPMKPPHSQANRTGRTLWSVPFLCAMLVSIPAHAIEVRIDPPEKTIRGLRGLFHRTVKQPK